MFDFSLAKLFILALIALVVLGPDKLPGAARTLGKFIQRVRSGWENVRSEVERELEVEEIRRTAREAAATAEAAQAQTSAQLERLHEELDSLRAAQQPDRASEASEHAALPASDGAAHEDHAAGVSVGEPQRGAG